MLPSELLSYRYNGEEVVPKRLALDNTNLAMARETITLFGDCRGLQRIDLDEQLEVLEGEDTDYRIKRGLAHILANAFCRFETVSPLEPQVLREKVFAHSAMNSPGKEATLSAVQRVAEALTEELRREVRPEQVEAGLYADLSNHQLMTEYQEPTPEALLHRYNLAQVQGVLYRAEQLTLTAHRNDPGEYKLLFRYLKLFQLMSYIEGHVEHGFTITVDGPTSLFKASTRYGLALAKLLPALLHVTRWSMVAQLKPRGTYDGTPETARFSLDSTCKLVSHYPPGKTYDSILEQAFTESWAKTKTEWQLEREVDLVPIPGSVMVPDFRLVHPDGRSYLLEIVGYWRPEYLKKKFAQVRKSGRSDLILAVSERLNLEGAGIKLDNVPAKIVWFKGKVSPKDVLEAIP